MRHAIEILEERKATLRALIRQCAENSDTIMQHIPSDSYQKQFDEVVLALDMLTLNERTVTTT